jgi:pentose-5-phosphate-3-epimerase
MDVGIAIKPKTSWEVVVPYLEDVNMVLVMVCNVQFGLSHLKRQWNLDLVDRAS